MGRGIVNAFGNNVPGHQIAPLAVEIFHKIDSAAIFHIVKSSTFTPGSFADKHSLLGRFNGGGVVLNKLQIFQLCALLIELGGNIAVTLGRACRLAEQKILTACCDHHSIGIDRFHFEGFLVVKQRTVTFSVPDQSRMELSKQHSGDHIAALVFSGFPDKGGHDLLAGRSACICGAVAALSAKGAQGYFPIFVSCKHHSK